MKARSQNNTDMSATATIDQATMQQWLREKLDMPAVESKLQAMGLDAESIKEHVKEYRKCCLAQRQFTGFVFMAVGAVMGFISCVLTIINPIPSLYHVILYGLTSLAIILIMIGLYYLFEG